MHTHPHAHTFLYYYFLNHGYQCQIQGPLYSSLKVLQEIRMVLSGLLDIWCQPRLSWGYVQNTACQLSLRHCHLSKKWWHIVIWSFYLVLLPQLRNTQSWPEHFHLSLMSIFLSLWFFSFPPHPLLFFGWRIYHIFPDCARCGINYLDSCLCRWRSGGSGGISRGTAAVAHLGVTDSRGRCGAGVAVERGDFRDAAVNQPDGVGG